MRFTKMEGAGNDYIYIDCFSSGTDHDWPRLSMEISDRHYGVGSDGLILIMPSRVADFRMRIFNKDGSEGDMCGNGLRCLSRYVYDHGLTQKTEFTVETRAGLMRPTLVMDGPRVSAVRVNMGKPSFKAADVPMHAPGYDEALDIEVSAVDRTFLVTGVRMGNPNGVIFVDDLDIIDLLKYGPVLESHPVFPKKANIEFTQVLSPEHIRMKVWERGSGVTLACGTGACACAVAAAYQGRSARTVTVSLPGGSLTVEWAENGDVFMTGPANEVCTGVFTRWIRREK